MKKTMKLIGFTVIATVIVFAFTVCDNGPGDKTQTMTFKGSDAGGDYVLLITQDAANRAFTVKPNDDYKLTYIGGRESLGKVTAASGDTLTLTPNDNTKPPITAKVSGDALTSLTSTGTNIVWDIGGETPAPGTAITPPTPPPTSGIATITVSNQQFHSANQQPDGTIFSPYTGSGKVYAEYWDYESENLLRRDEIGVVTNGILSFKLQVAPPAAALYNMSEVLNEEMGVSVNVNPNNTKINQAELFFVDSNNVKHYLGCASDEINMGYWYADRNVSANFEGKIDEEQDLVINLTLKTGWNTFYSKYDVSADKFSVTTTNPEPAKQLKWAYYQ
ncbi:MAG: hypothetical protein LBG94_06970 [Treponema sp.]|jgi:hypothetical protein|nr:hypothetical protein [Treponema sp.]